ncbi:MAG: phosphotransferase [Vulcanimicrobiaceae bacterium]
MTPPLWTADIEVDASLAAKLLAEQFPQLSRAAVEPFGLGWDNAAFLVGGRLVFRFPRRRAVACLIERETALLPLIATRLPLAISAPSFVGAATAEYPWVFAGYELITGSTACSVALPDATRAALARPLSGFLRALHAIDSAPLEARGLPPDEIGRLDHAKRIAMTRERLPGLVAAGLVERPDVFTAWLETHPPLPLRPAKRRIDWGDIHVGDPALDVAIAHLVLPPNAHRAFREAYGPIDGRTWRAARYRAIYHAVLELDYGMRENDAGMRDSGAAALRLIRPEIERSRSARLRARFSEQDLPALDADGPQQLHTPPRIGREASLDSLFALGFDNEHPLGAVAERASQNDEALLDEAVHIRRVLVPAFLFAHRARSVPSGSALERNDEVGHSAHASRSRAARASWKSRFPVCSGVRSPPASESNVSKLMSE